MAAPQGKDGVGAPDCPEHSGLLETFADHGFATGLDDARANKQMLAAKLGVLHSLSVPLKVIGFDSDLLGHLGIDGVD